MDRWIKLCYPGCRRCITRSTYGAVRCSDIDSIIGSGGLPGLASLWDWGKNWGPAARGVPDPTAIARKCPNPPQSDIPDYGGRGAC